MCDFFATTAYSYESCTMLDIPVFPSTTCFIIHNNTNVVTNILQYFLHAQQDLLLKRYIMKKEEWSNEHFQEVHWIFHA